jgi:hypothetical protein
MGREREEGQRGKGSGRARRGVSHGIMPLKPICFLTIGSQNIHSENISLLYDT